jgi:hypothetical protein
MKGKTARKLLPEKYRSMFENKMIVCIEYEGLNDDQEREMFQVFPPPSTYTRPPHIHPLESADGNGANTRRQVHFHFSKGSCNLCLQNVFKLSTGLFPT